VTKPFSLRELKLVLEGIAADLRFKSDNRMQCEKLKNDQGTTSTVWESIM